jgi:TolB-like protein/Flp pilus assembly protein TadD
MIDERGHAKVLDFGIAKLVELDALATGEATAVAETTAGKFLGTLQYVSPEQAGGITVDHRSDIFSLGVVMYEMLTGKNPFAASTFLDTVRRVREVTPDPIERRDCPAELKRIVFKCLEKDPQRRYQTLRDLVLDLEPTAAPPRKETRWVVPAAIYVSLVVAIIAGSIWFGSRLTKTAPAATAAKINSIAVLPFVNFSPDRQNEYIGDGISEEVINGLAQLNGLKVVSRTSSFAYKGSREDVRNVGKSLGVDAVVEGSVQRAGNKLRVTAQLINTHDGFHLWSQTYSGAVDDVFSIEDQISRSVAKALQRTMGRGSASPSTRDITAYDLYLKARHEESTLTRENFDNAVAAFRAAIDRDPSFAEAYGGLAETYSLMDHRPGLTPLDPKETYALALEAANKALSLDPDSVEAHTALGHIDMHLGRFDEARMHLQRALQINPNFTSALLWHSILVRLLGDYPTCKLEASRAVQLDPLSTFVITFVVPNSWTSGDFSTALALAERGAQLDPQDGAMFASIAEADAALGRFGEAEAALRRAAEVRKVPTLEQSHAMVLALAGRKREAAELLKRIAPTVRGAGMPRMMRAWAAVGDDDEAARWLNRVVAETPEYGRLAIDLPPHPGFLKFRGDPRYLEGRRKLGLPPPAFSDTAGTSTAAR